MQSATMRLNIVDGMVTTVGLPLRQADRLGVAVHSPAGAPYTGVGVGVGLERNMCARDVFFTPKNSPTPKTVSRGGAGGVLPAGYFLTIGFQSSVDLLFSLSPLRRKSVQNKIFICS